MKATRRHDNIVEALRRKDPREARAAVETALIAGFDFISKAHGWSINFSPELI